MRLPGSVWKPGLSRTMVDAAFLLALCVVGLLALSTTFTGLRFLAVGVAGVLLGVAIAALVRRVGWPGISGVGLGVVVFVLLGGPLCLTPSRGAGALLPGPGTLSALVDQVVFGWKDLLTTLPPIDGSGPSLVLPWLLGLAAGLFGTLFSSPGRGPFLLRPVLPALPLLAPVALLVVVILVGVRRPQSVWLQGVVFTVLAVGWLAVRTQRSRGPVLGSGGRVRRGVAGAVLVAVAGVLALPVSGWLGGTDDGDRVVLRTYVTPPFDVGRYPSPLASFRRYVKMPKPDAANLYDTTMFTVAGAPAGSRIRIAALDHYDGTVWGASNNEDPDASDDTFEKVSSTIDDPVRGTPADVTVTVGPGYSDVWLPTIGALQSVHFDSGPGSDAADDADAFRYNLATGTGVIPTGVHPGDVYHFSTVEPDDTVTARDAPSDEVTDAAFAAAFLDTQAVQWSAGASAPMQRVFAIANYLKTNGKYSDGVIASERIYHPGHYERRLDEEFANAPIMVGNDEQYAAIMALLANKVGVPARVVLGAVVPSDGVVKGKDIQAWVELQVADGSWRTLPTDAFMSHNRPAQQPPQSQQELSGTNVPPPAPIPPPSTLADQNDTDLTARTAHPDDGGSGGGLPGWLGAALLYAGSPLLVVVLLVGAVLGAKAWRRRRRRHAAAASTRVVGAWRELVDHARDLGHAVPVGSGHTRREQSFRVGSLRAPDLARRADTQVFGPTRPDDASAASYWTEIDAERRTMSAGVSRARRVRAALSLATFRSRSA